MAKCWAAQFKDLLREGGYLFHFHTNWTDGEDSLAGYCVIARELGFKTLILLEHIRAIPSYDVHALLKSIPEHEKRYGVAIIPGFEAKILANGVIDLPGEIWPGIGALGIAEHTFPGDDCSLIH